MSSPSNHDFHHYNGYNNYGAIFSFWDQLFGTYTTWEDKAKKMGIPEALLDTHSESDVIALTKSKRDIARICNNSSPKPEVYQKSSHPKSESYVTQGPRISDRGL